MLKNLFRLEQTTTMHGYCPGVECIFIRIDGQSDFYF